MKFDLSIGQRLAIGLTLLLLIFAAMLLAAFRAQGSSARAELAFTQEIAPLQERSFELEKSVYRLALSVRTYLLNPEEGRLADFQRRVAAARAALAALHDSPKSETSTRLYADLAPVVYLFLLEAEHVVAAGKGAADLRSERALAQTRERALDAIRAFSAFQGAQAQTALSGMAAARDRGVKELAAAAVLALLFFITLAVLLAESIRRPTRAMIGVAQAFRRGLWAPALAWAPEARKVQEPRNELDQLARALGAAAEALAQRERRLEAELEVARATSASLDKQQIAQHVLLTVVRHVDAAAGVVYLCGAGTQQLTPLATFGEELYEPAAFPGATCAEDAVRNRETVVVHDSQAAPAPEVCDDSEKFTPPAIAAVPVSFGPDVVGVLVVATVQPIDQEIITFLQSTATRLAAGLGNAIAHEALQGRIGRVHPQQQRAEAPNARRNA